MSKSEEAASKQNWVSQLRAAKQKRENPAPKAPARDVTLPKKRPEPKK